MTTCNQVILFVFFFSNAIALITQKPGIVYLQHGQPFKPAQKNTWQQQAFAQTHKPSDLKSQVLTNFSAPRAREIWQTAVDEAGLTNAEVSDSATITPKFPKSWIERLEKQQIIEDFDFSNLSMTDSAASFPGKHLPAIYTILAGRKAFLMMQEPFWVQMVASGAIKEVHLWDYTNYDGVSPSSNAENKEYLQHLQLKYKFVRIFAAPNPVRYLDYYQYYKDNPYNGLVIKADDDIVYVNTSMVQSYLNYMEEHNDIFMLSASVVNQGLCAYYQQKHGAIDPAYEKFPFPQNGIGRLHDNGTQSLRLHKWFQEHPTDFYVPDDVVYPIPYTININFVVLRGGAFSEVWELLMDQVPKDRTNYYDEGAMTWDAIRKRGKKEAIYMGLVVAHMGYGAQLDSFQESLQLWEQYYHLNQKSFVRQFGRPFLRGHFEQTMQQLARLHGFNHGF